MRRDVLVKLISVAALAALAGCNPGKAVHDHVWFDPVSYRLTVEVETPAGIKSGSSVIETIYDRGLSGSEVHGEAVAVDVAPGKTLFVLLRSPTNADWAAGLPGIPMIEADEPAGNHAEREAQVGRQLAAARADRTQHFLWGVGVPSTRSRYLPYLVWFSDIHKPETVEQVDPVDLEKTFGSGFRLKSISTKITSEPVSDGIRGRLPWLEKYPEPTLASIPGGGVRTPTLGQILRSGDFAKGEPQ